MTRIAALAPLASLALVSAPPTYIVGFVQDTNCAPLAGAQISIGRPTTSPVVTDAQGRFVIAVPDGHQRVDLSARVSGFRQLTRSNVRVGPGARDSHTLTLHPAIAIIADPIITTGGQPQITPEPVKDIQLRGEILTTACTPIQDAQVGVSGNGLGLHARSDAAGRFAFPAMTHGSYTLEVRTNGYIPVVRRGTTVDDTTPHVRVLLERGDDGEIDSIK
jgi:uncharacterized protein YfaP (DUF2135 family)